ncbi:MAG TPA: alpha/beta fold hydrolase, partial [Nocardioides sp.]|nr:alpha/beta fold hydrolase [Nocardioides sp.]
MTTHQNQPTGQPTGQPLALRPFTVAVPQDALDDLHARLTSTRYAAEPAGTPADDWSAGAPVSYLRDMVARWRDDFDWRAQEERMNAHPQYLTEIDGQTVHFVHVRSANEDATPLLLLHTYPGSFADFLDLVPHLTDDFHLVIPSLPGVGFSQPLADG